MLQRGNLAVRKMTGNPGLRRDSPGRHTEGRPAVSDSATLRTNTAHLYGSRFIQRRE